ncbi:cobaltochelatase subunit CobN [Desulfothermobacter acidiphilus]|uniref:cobaltochelatase subunit CobN n=1 Tax=Desulfothermobacter acidiphilus TaxID=1938353 RepID=UPI003F8AE31D
MLKIAGFRVIYGPSAVGRVYQEAVAELAEAGLPIEFRYSQPPAAGMPLPPPEWLEFAQKEADAVFFSFPPEFKALGELFGRWQKELSQPLVPVTREVATLGNVAPEAAQRAITYHLYGGKENLKAFFRWLGELAGRMPAGSAPAPQELPWAGIYHHRAQGCFTSLEEYLAWYGERRPLVGLLFPRVFWVEENLAGYDAIIQEIERRGAGVIPVFSDGWFGQVRNDEVIRQFFFRNGKPIIEALIAYSAFFLKTRREVAVNREPVEDVLLELKVPILKMIHAARQTEAQWQEDPQGLNLPQVIISITLPEFDGLIEPWLVSVAEDEGEFPRARPLPEQVSYLVDRLFHWLKLRRKPNCEKKVAFILLNSPCKSVEATVGTAFGLDSLESLARILKRLEEEGYRVDWVPESGRELAEAILGRKALPDFRWTTLEEVVEKGGAAALVPLEKYLQWFEELPREAREKVAAAWGDPREAERASGVQKLALGLYRGQVVIPGIVSGNVFIGVQPKRGCAGSKCDGEVCKILHDPDVPPPHQWIAWHKWLEEEFGADVVVHVGTHGVLELLPGKTTALSEACFPRISLGKVPHLYLYNLTNPMEAVVAKRRSAAVIVDHLPPVLASMRLSGDLADLEELLEDYQKAVSLKEKGRAEIIRAQMAEKARRAGLCAEDETPDPEVLHEKLTLLRESQFRDGLHIIGEAPEGEALAELLNAVLRLDQPDCPSWRRVLARYLGLDYDLLLKEPQAFLPAAGVSHGKLLEEIDQLGKEILGRVENLPEEAVDEALAQARECLSRFARKRGLSLDDGAKDSLTKVLAKALRIVPLVRRTTDEVENLLRGLAGEFIPPGASGALARGKVEVLPTGRNMYSIDPWRIPTAAAWEVGKRLAEELLARSRGEDGSYPETIGFTLRAMDPFRADGELIAQILYTLGVEPVWVAGRVVSLKPIPLEKLGRPRIDCLVNLSSILRDGMPRAFELIDQAVKMVAELEEPPEQNFVRKHVLEREAELRVEHGEEEARKLATLRVFSSAPGTYGTGVELAVASSAWKEEQDLAEVYFHWTGYAYGEGVYARKAPAELVDRCRRVSVTFEKFDSDEIDLLDCCHIYGVHGGFTVAAKVASGQEPKTFFGATHDPDRPVIRTLREELSRIAHTRLLNPAWIEGKKRHGYKGAGDISSRVNHMYGWQATTRQVENWVFDGIAQKFVLDEENRKFFQENNPWALEEIARRLLEAASRELWQADPEFLARLKEVYLEIEGWLEERMGEVKGEFQGGAVEVRALGEMEGWAEKLAEVRRELESGRANEVPALVFRSGRQAKKGPTI